MTSGPAFRFFVFRQAEDIIRLNEEDNMGIRWFLMHVYAGLEDAEAAQRLLSTYGCEASVLKHTAASP